MRTRVVLSMLVMIANLVVDASFLRAAQEIVSKVEDGSGTSCFLRFPAIREETLYWARPVLKDPNGGDIISFYGRCDHDPLGRFEILRQRDEHERRRRRLPAGD
jgi:hypothetical protein